MLANSNMTDAQTCLECGSVLHGRNLEGYCRRCISRLVFDPALADSPNIEVAPQRVIGDFELMEEVGRGGMGIVWRARQRSLDRVVALKFIAAGVLASREFRERFRQEAATVARLQHPNIVSVYEAGEHDGHAWMAMEFVAGRSLADLAREGPLPARAAAGQVRTIAGAIQHAHERGVLHRDLKPSNILLDAEGEPRVTDFGLAKLMTASELETGNSELTQSGHALGSPSFCAPEQCRVGSPDSLPSARRAQMAGEPSDGNPPRDLIGPAVDVYGLGAILYHLLTGRPPFLGATIGDTLRAVQQDEAVWPRRLNSAVPRDLETICLKCLEKEPVKRYASARELGEELGRFLDGQPICARPITRAERTWRWCRRKPALASSFVLALVLLLVVTIGAPIAVLRTSRARAEAESARFGAEKNLYAADMKLASQAVRDGTVDHARYLLNRHRPQPGAADLRGFEWRYLWGATEQREVVRMLAGLPSPVEIDPVRLVRVGDTLYNVDRRASELRAWNMTDWTALPSRLASPEAFDRWIWCPSQQEALAVDNTHRTLTLYQLPGFRKVREIPLQGLAIHSALSPDGQLLAVCVENGARQRVSVWDLQRNTEREVPAEFPAHIFQIKFSNDGTVLAVPSSDGVIGLWDIATLNPIPGPPTSAASRHFVQFAPHGSRFIYWNEVSQALSLWDRVAGKFTFLEQGFQDGKEFSPNGELLALAWSDVVSLYDGKSHERVGELRGHEASVRSIAFSPDGRLVATGSRDRTARLWDLKTRRQLATLGGHAGEVYNLTFSADGNRLVTISTDGVAKVWDVPAALERNLLVRGSTLNWWLRMSADERLLASADHAGRIHVWDRLSRA